MIAFRAFAAALIGLVFALSAGAQTAERRVALVIGNSAYSGLPALPNPANDAGDIAARLRALGFEVVLGLDLTRAGFQRTLFDFAARLNGAETSLLFYAGHGVQVNDVNHLIPVDAELAEGDELAGQTVTVDRIVGMMNEFTRTTIVLLDACRDNPLTNRAAARSDGQVIGRGLAQVQTAGGSYIAFATGPGSVAYDGEGRNSPFTAALLTHIERPNIDIRLMMADVRRDVFRATGQQQLPWENSSLIGRFYFHEGAQDERPDGGLHSETEAWAAIAESTRREDFAGFLQEFPAGSFAAVATLQMAALERIDRQQSAEGADFVLARSAGTEEDWSDFITRHPDGLFAQLATEELERLREEIRRSRLSIEEIHWRSIRNSRNAADFAQFLALYPRGAFSDLAEERQLAAARAEAMIRSLTGRERTEDVRDVELERDIKERVAQVPVQFVQYGLNALGHQVGDLSGVLDVPTRRAIRNYQATIGAEQTGRLDPQQTVDLILAAAALGESHAMTAVGIMTASGNGLRQDEETARLWLDRASDLGNGLAMANLGVMYRDGRGGSRNLRRARSLLTVAVALGVEGADPILRSIAREEAR